MEPEKTENPVPLTATTASSTGLPPNIAAALACFPLIGGIVFFILEKRDQFVRFYAMQSIIFGAAWFLFRIVQTIVHLILRPIPGIGFFLSGIWAFAAGIIELAFLVVLVIAMVKAFTGVRWEIPYIGPEARKHTDPPIL